VAVPRRERACDLGYALGSGFAPRANLYLVAQSFALYRRSHIFELKTILLKHLSFTLRGKARTKGAAQMMLAAKPAGQSHRLTSGGEAVTEILISKRNVPLNL